MLDDLAFAVEAKDVNASSFLAGPIQITHVLSLIGFICEMGRFIRRQVLRLGWTWRWHS